MNPTIAFIQARMSSSRFPGKVLEPLDGEPLIVYMARRASRARLLDRVVIVTSTDPSDNPLAHAIEAADLQLFRGDLDDVLHRYLSAAQAHDAHEIVRLTGDCPLIDPAVIDAVIDARRRSGVDYASNVETPTFPDGLDVECFTREALERAASLARRAPEREHVTLWMRNDEHGLRRINHKAIANFSSLRLTVDYPDDLALIRALVGQLPPNGSFDWFDIMRVLSRQPELIALNQHERNEGLTKSLAEERSRLA